MSLTLDEAVSEKHVNLTHWGVIQSGLNATTQYRVSLQDNNASEHYWIVGLKDGLSARDLTGIFPVMFERGTPVYLCLNRQMYALVPIHPA